MKKKKYPTLMFDVYIHPSWSTWISAINIPTFLCGFSPRIFHQSWKPKKGFDICKTCPFLGCPIQHICSVCRTYFPFWVFTSDPVWAVCIKNLSTKIRKLIWSFGIYNNSVSFIFSGWPDMPRVQGSPWWANERILCSNCKYRGGNL